MGSTNRIIFLKAESKNQTLADGTFFSLSRLAVLLRNPHGASLENPWCNHYPKNLRFSGTPLKQFPELFFAPFKSPQNQNKKTPFWVFFHFGAADGTFFSLSRLAVLLCNPHGASLENPWCNHYPKNLRFSGTPLKQFPELFFAPFKSPQNQNKKTPFWVFFYFGAADGT